MKTKCNYPYKANCNNSINVRTMQNNGFRIFSFAHKTTTISRECGSVYGVRMYGKQAISNTNKTNTSNQI